MDAASATTVILKGEFKIAKKSEFGKIPTCKLISRKYDPAAVA
jgi:hypothetical protein